MSAEDCCCETWAKHYDIERKAHEVTKWEMVAMARRGTARIDADTADIKELNCLLDAANAGRFEAERRCAAECNAHEATKLSLATVTSERESARRIANDRENEYLAALGVIAAELEAHAETRRDLESSRLGWEDARRTRRDVDADRIRLIDECTAERVSHEATRTLLAECRAQNKAMAETMSGLREADEESKRIAARLGGLAATENLRANACQKSENRVAALLADETARRKSAEDALATIATTRSYVASHDACRAHFARYPGGK